MKMMYEPVEPGPRLVYEEFDLDNFTERVRLPGRDRYGPENEVSIEALLKRFNDYTDMPLSDIFISLNGPYGAEILFRKTLEPSTEAINLYNQKKQKYDKWYRENKDEIKKFEEDKKADAAKKKARREEAEATKLQKEINTQQEKLKKLQEKLKR